MGNVGCEKEPSILHRTAWPSTHALHQNNQALACQPGWEWEEWPGMWLLSEFQRTRMRIWERMQNSRGGKKKNAAAFVVKEDFLYCQTARASVIPSNILRESGKIWKNWTLHKEGRLKKQTKKPKNYSSLHQHLFLLCSDESQAHFTATPRSWSTEDEIWWNQSRELATRRSTLMRKRGRILTFSLKLLISLPQVCVCEEGKGRRVEDNCCWSCSLEDVHIKDASSRRSNFKSSYP